MNQQMIPRPYAQDPLMYDDYNSEDDDFFGPGDSHHPMMRRMTFPFVYPRVHPTGPILDEYQFQRAYCYDSGFRPGAAVYHLMGSDLHQLRNFLNGVLPVENLKPLMDALAQRSPYEIEALKYAFGATSNGVELWLALKAVLERNGESQAVIYAVVGLLLGPVGFDIWLLNEVPGIWEYRLLIWKELSHRDKDILIDIFVGRDREDISYLETRYQQRSRQTLATAIAIVQGNNNLNYPELKDALNICAEGNRPPLTDPVDDIAVNADVTEIIRILDSDKPSHVDFFRILLRRSDPHIKQINIFYQNIAGKQLDEGIRQCQAASKMTKRIATHAVRSAIDPAYRDVMLLRRAMGAEHWIGRGRDELLAMRIVRMHWYRHHFRAVKQKYMILKGKQLVDKVKKKDGFLGEVLVSLVQIW